MYAYHVIVFTPTGTRTRYCERPALDATLNDLGGTDPQRVTYSVKPVPYTEHEVWQAGRALRP